MVLLDYPDSEGVTRELDIGTRRRLTDRKAVLIATVSATFLLVAAVAGRAVLRSAATGPAPGIHIPLMPFPSVSAGSSPSATARAPGKRPTPEQNTASVPSLMPSLVPPTASSPDAASAQRNTQQAIAVRYLVVARADGGYQFEGEVHVVNDGSAPISGWQIAVALPYDEITAIGGASGYVSNHILLMQPDPDTGSLATGGQLSVFFVAEGPEMTPELCAFDDTPCG